jgi:hypothetical protein
MTPKAQLKASQVVADLQRLHLKLTGETLPLSLLASVHLVKDDWELTEAEKTSREHVR